MLCFIYSIFTYPIVSDNSTLEPFIGKAANYRYFSLEKRKFMLKRKIGSLLGVELKDLRSEPVGYMGVKDMYPLNFEEFIACVGINENVIA